MYIILDLGSITQVGFMKEPKAIPPRESFNVPFIELAEKDNSRGYTKIYLLNTVMESDLMHTRLQ